MRLAILAALCAVLVQLAACSTFSDVRSFDRNDALIAANGTIVLKGFGGQNAGSVVCIAPSAPYSVDASDSVKGSADVKNIGTAAVDRTLALKTSLAMKQTERLQAMRELMTQLCIAYGNGLLGPVGASGTTEKYQALLRSFVDMYATMTSQEPRLENPQSINPAPAPQPRSSPQVELESRRPNP